MSKQLHLRIALPLLRHVLETFNAGAMTSEQACSELCLSRSRLFAITLPFAEPPVRHPQGVALRHPPRRGLETFGLRRSTQGTLDGGAEGVPPQGPFHEAARLFRLCRIRSRQAWARREAGPCAGQAVGHLAGSLAPEAEGQAVVPHEALAEAQRRRAVAARRDAVQVVRGRIRMPSNAEHA